MPVSFYDGPRKNSFDGWCFLSFHPAMTDEEVCELLTPFKPAKIERKSDTYGNVGFWDATYDEMDQLRARFNAWRDDYERQQLANRKPFDYEAYLRSRGLDPVELEALQPRKFRRRSDYGLNDHR
jgi:hypothetical protein